MPTARARAASLFTLLLLVALAMTALPAAPSRASVTAGVPAAAPAAVAVAANAVASAVAASATPDPAHPYSDPVWFPLRNTARVGCVYSNCPGPYHGYWAIDFGGSLNDPIYAAGAGVFHIGNIDHSCPSSGVTAGTWVWIDHGPAGITRYHHLNQVIAKEGQLVTPGTEIGTMGNNGNTAPCTVSYLHMEWHAIGTSTIRLPIPTMYACGSSGQLTFPADLGYSSWNSMPNNEIHTPALTSGCQPSSWSQTPDRPVIDVNRASRAAVVIPSARPAGTDRWRDMIEEYFPSLHSYRMIAYHDHYPTTSSTTISGLTDGRTYRITGAIHNGTGWSAWGASTVVIPASPPSVPAYRGLTHGSNWALYSWYRSSSSGSSTATYQVARRCYFTGAWHSWVYTTVPGTNISYEWHPIAPHMTCEVTVRAHNPVGWSAFSTRKFVTTS